MSISNLINLPSRCHDMSVGVCLRAKFPVEFVNENAPAKCFYDAFLPFAFHAKPFLDTSTISYTFGVGFACYGFWMF